MTEKRKPKVKYFDMSRERELVGGRFTRPRKHLLKEKVKKEK